MVKICNISYNVYIILYNFYTLSEQYLLSFIENILQQICATKCFCFASCPLRCYEPFLGFLKISEFLFIDRVDKRGAALIIGVDIAGRPGQATVALVERLVGSRCVLRPEPSRRLRDDGAFQ